MKNKLRLKLRLEDPKRFRRLVKTCGPGRRIEETHDYTLDKQKDRWPGDADLKKPTCFGRKERSEGRIKDQKKN
jgi:hypothetical protein